VASSPCCAGLAMPDASTQNRIKNVSWLFAMSDAQMHCGFDKVVLVSSMQFKNVFLVSPQATIKTGKEGAFRCAIGGEQYNLLQVTPFSLKSAHMFLSMRRGPTLSLRR
jgi:hypothetical protein